MSSTFLAHGYCKLFSYFFILILLTSICSGLCGYRATGIWRGTTISRPTRRWWQGLRGGDNGAVRRTQGMTREMRGQGPRDVDDVSWAVRMFFFHLYCIWISNVSLFLALSTTPAASLPRPNLSPPPSLSHLPMHVAATVPRHTGSRGFFCSFCI